MESAPFVSLESQDDIWDDENSDDLSPGLQPARIHYKRPTICTPTRIAVGVVIGVLVIVIVTLGVLVAQRKETKEAKVSLCLKSECITTSYGKWIVKARCNFCCDLLSAIFSF
jgi:hypothetical protein